MGTWTDKETWQERGKINAGYRSLTSVFLRWGPASVNPFSTCVFVRSAVPFWWRCPGLKIAPAIIQISTCSAVPACIICCVYLTQSGGPPRNPIWQFRVRRSVKMQLGSARQKPAQEKKTDRYMAVETPRSLLQITDRLLTSRAHKRITLRISTLSNNHRVNPTQPSHTHSHTQDTPVHIEHTMTNVELSQQSPTAIAEPVSPVEEPPKKKNKRGRPRLQTSSAAQAEVSMIHDAQTSKFRPIDVISSIQGATGSVWLSWKLLVVFPRSILVS